MLNLEKLAEFCRLYADDLTPEVTSFELRGTWFHPHPDFSLMGVVNLSADSWYRESIVLSADAAIRRGIRLAAEGAKLVDVGAESTLLSAAIVDETLQQSTLIPVVKGLSDQGILVSVETYHPAVTAACLEAGAAVLNLTAADDTEAHYRLVADYDAAVIICYIQNGKNAREVGDFQFSDDYASISYDYLAREIDKATQAGVQKLWIDPAIGFDYTNLEDSAVRTRHQMRTFLNAFRLRRLGWPVCQALPFAFEYFEEELRTGEAFFAVLALLGKADLLRTHEVAKVRGVCRTMDIYT